MKAFQKLLIRLNQEIFFNMHVDRFLEKVEAESKQKSWGGEKWVRLIKKPWRKKPARYNFSKLLSASFHDGALHIQQHTKQQQRQEGWEKVSLWKKIAASTTLITWSHFTRWGSRAIFFALNLATSKKRQQTANN